MTVLFTLRGHLLTSPAQLSATYRDTTQHLVHQVAQVLAPACVPLFLTDGFKEYLKAVLTHYGHWVPRPRSWATGRLPKPRWLPLPQLQYAQVIKTTRRRRLVAVRSRVVFGTLAGIKQVLATTGWQINSVVPVSVRDMRSVMRLLCFRNTIS
jgi:hypothetical protein